MIEDAKAVLRTWGAADPNFLLCNSKLTFQMTMIPEKTQYLTQGPDGMRRLKTGPNINMYRGLNIINSRSFSMEDGAPPRDVLRRRVRVAEYYRIPWEEGIQDRHFAFYDESKDAWQKYSWHDLFSMSQIGEVRDGEERNGRIIVDDDNDDNEYDSYISKKYKSVPTKLPKLGMKGVPVDFMISREAWDLMNDKNMHEDIDPVRRLHDVGNTVPEKKPFDDAKLDEVKKACGLPLDIEDKDAEEYLNSSKTYRWKFVSFLKDWLIGNTVPYIVNSFLESFNWQGFDDATTLRDDDRREENFQVILSSILDIKTKSKPVSAISPEKWEIVVIRPNIEHNMLGLVMGRGGLEELGATFWGQTELSCFDDSMHGKL
jgi:hypothetical protein